MTRGEVSGYHLTREDVHLVLGMQARGDRDHDIAAYFGVNQGRVAEPKEGKFGSFGAAPSTELPPKGPPGIKGRRLRGQAEAALLALTNNNSAEAIKILKSAIGHYWPRNRPRLVTTAALRARDAWCKTRSPRWNASHRPGKLLDKETDMTRYTPRDRDGLLKALDGQPGYRKVEAEFDTGVSAGTVDELRAMQVWPANLVVTTPSKNYPEATVRISRAT